MNSAQKKIETHKLMLTAALLSVITIGGCSRDSTANMQRPPQAMSNLLPLSDPQNTGKWILNTQVSDEFEGSAIDEERWYIVGKLENGKPVYKHPDKPNKKVWKGRAPSQFSGNNYRLENGKLKLETRWEPDFPFEEKIHKPVFGDPLKYENITTACFIGRKSFQYGYIEIKSKAADAQVSSAFWSMGEKLEVDFLNCLVTLLTLKKTI